VAFERMFTLDLTSTSDSKAFFRTGFGFHFWHFRQFLDLLSI
jgi:hypothetical protein